MKNILLSNDKKINSRFYASKRGLIFPSLLNRFLLLLLSFLLLGQKTTQAQELNAQVIVEANQLRMVEPRVFETLEKDLKEFLNSTKWTNDRFGPEERIECSFLINIVEEVSATRFKANVTVQSNRPVYQSAYNTLLLNYQDKTWDFEYSEFEPLNFNENTYLSELTALMAYYTYVIIGLDYDSFSKEGGTPHLLKAQQIVSQAQNSSKATSSGWKTFDGTRNRYWLIENLLNDKFRSLRQAYYDYHRSGLDYLSSDPTKAHKFINNALTMISRVNRNNPNTMGTDMFMITKKDELIDIFASKEVSSRDRAKAYTTLIQVDPSNTNDYGEINKAGVSGQGIPQIGGKNGNRNNGRGNTPYKGR